LGTGELKFKNPTKQMTLPVQTSFKNNQWRSGVENNKKTILKIAI
jgi:hypothetical protein